MTILIDGKALRNKILTNLKSKIEKLSGTPELAVILVGNDPASRLYVNNKQRAAETAGIKTRVINLDAKCSEYDIINEIKLLNDDKSVNAVLVQMPLPKHIDANKVINAIDPHKDVDCLTIENTGRLYSNNKPFIMPCTPRGVISLLDEYAINISGKHAVVIGRSNIVGRPMAHALLNRNATVTTCHSYTENLTEFTKTADIVVSAVGKNIIDGSGIKHGAVVINIGQHIDKNGKISGDIDYESMQNIAGYLTPITGSTGPMTIASLMQNTYDLFCMQNQCK